MIFQSVGDDRPYPAHGRVTPRDWADVPPRPVRLEQLTTTKSSLNLHDLLAEDSTFYGDLFPHVVVWRGRHLSLIHISEPTRRLRGSRMPSSA